MKKDAETKFLKILYNKDTDESLILCNPVNGRTH